MYKSTGQVNEYLASVISAVDGSNTSRSGKLIVNPAPDGRWRSPKNY
jgi:hypothetical protein